MSQLIRDQTPFITMFRYSGRKKLVRDDLLLRSSISQVKAFVEIASNTLYGVLPTNSEQHHQLVPIKRLLKILANPKLSLRYKRQILLKYSADAYKLILIVHDTLRALLWGQ